ncbi:MAG: filamentous hemagglutinin N-terminal domain-containing protein [Xenococcus sp. (in: cyanobacteria)]
MQRALISLFYSTLPLAILGCLIPVNSVAQVTPDGTTNTIVNQSGNDFTIEEGSRVGDNLFHSFDEFSVPTLGSATFNNAIDIANIFSRVTGSNISTIDGLLSANGLANLFLINPNGIIFGENARLNFGGSFFASSAESLLFEENAEFSASNPQAPPLLKVSIPIGINFRDNPGNITNQATDVGLEVNTGKTLALIGGNIDFENGQITAPGANVWLGGLSESGTVNLTNNFDLNIPDGIARADISFSDGSLVNTASDNGGGITVIGNSITFSEASQLLGGIAADSGFSGAEAGDINLSATGAVNLGGDSSIRNQVNGSATGNSGDINVVARSLTLTEGSSFSASTFGRGNAGSVEITARDTITFDGEDSRGFPSGAISQVTSSAVGNAGGVTITTGSLNLTNGGRVDASTFGQGNAGSVEISASDTITIDGEDLGGSSSGAYSQVASGAVGDAVGVTIATGSLTLTNGGVVSASTLGQGNAGSVEISASDTITFDGEDLGGIPSGIENAVGTEAVGNAGGISITTGSLNLTNGGRVTASTFGQGDAGSVEITASDTITIDGEDLGGFPSGAGSQVASGAVGNAVGVTITTGNLTLTNGGIVSASTFGRGDAGSVEISASDTITIDGGDSRGFPSGAGSQVNPGAVGNAVGVTITTGSLTLTNGGLVSASTGGQGNAGSVEISASDAIIIDGEDLSGSNSGAYSQVASGAEGDAVGVTITTGSLTLTNGGLVSASTGGQGDAGSVEISASDTITIDGEQSGGIPSGATSQVASGAEGDAGGVTIATGSLTLTNGGLVDASTFGQGDAGSVEITASDTITFDGEDSDGFASGANSSVNPDALGNAGGITITTGYLTLTNGGRVIASTVGQGNAGDVTVHARESITITGVAERFRSGIYADALASNGNGGNINVFTDKLTINDGGTIEASNFDSFGIFAPGTGEPGNINIQANSLSLSNQARIDAATQSQTGDNANITLQLTEDLILRNNSLISARALEEANGGNLNIGADFIVAFPNQDSDIIANASQGKGGNITIDALSLFGIEERPLNPLTNDIDVSSEFGLQGEISVNTLELDPTSGLINLPEAVADAAEQISQNFCEQGVGSEFIITGKGGLPPNPHETLNSDEEQVGLVEPVPLRQGEEIKLEENDIRSEKSKAELVPAQGWIFNEKGEVTLTPYKTHNTEIKPSPQKIPNICPTP